MAIAFESHTGSAKTTSSSTTGPSFSLTCDGSANERVWVAIAQQNATASVTYAGVSMTEVSSSPAVDSGYYLRLFYLDSPTSGANTVAITFGSAIVANACGAVYSGVATGVDSNATASNSGTPAASLTASTTVVASNCWLVMGIISSDGPHDPTAGTNATLRVAISDANTISLGLFDSNGTVGTGSQSMQATFTSPVFASGVIASFAPSGGASGGGPLMAGGELLRSALLRGGRLVG